MLLFEFVSCSWMAASCAPSVGVPQYGAVLRRCAMENVGVGGQAAQCATRAQCFQVGPTWSIWATSSALIVSSVVCCKWDKYLRRRALRAMHLKSRQQSTCHAFENLSSSDVLVPLPFSKRVFLSSWLAMLTVLFAMSHGRWLCAFLGTACCAASVNHWRMPQNGLRRLVDIACANAVLGYHLGLTVGAWGSQRPSCVLTALTCAPQRPLVGFAGPYVRALGPSGYWVMSSLGVACYLMAKRCAQSRSFDAGTRWHVAFHCLANASIILLYPALPDC